MGGKEIVENSQDHANNNTLLDIYQSCPIPVEEKLENLSLFINRRSMSRYVFMYELYRRILNVHGVIFEFGVRWGQDLTLFQSFRGMLEPFNYTRKIVGFDTFEGFPSLSIKDKGDVHKVGDLSVTKEYEAYLKDVMSYHESVSPIPHIPKYEIIKGDASVTCKEYLERHPETVISFAYFDMDIYEPTKACLELCKDRFTKGSVIAFDEVNHPDWPGETLALMEVLGMRNIHLQRFPYMPNASFCVFE